MSTFSVERYNQLLPIDIADARFKQQLASAGITRDQLFFQLGPLFAPEKQTGPYAVCLLHRHYPLYDGERMVTKGNSTMPSSEPSGNFIAESWLNTGEDFEYRDADISPAPAPPPSLDFLAKFRAVLDSYGIDVLGVSYAPDINELGPESKILERQGSRDREQALVIVDASSIDPNKSSEAAWILGLNDDQDALTPSYRDCNCCDHGPWTNLQWH